jgi:hypothetical protein
MEDPTCHLCHRPAGSLLNRYGEPDGISPTTALGPLATCECGRVVCPECRDECCEKENG